MSVCEKWMTHVSADSAGGETDTGIESREMWTALLEDIDHKLLCCLCWQLGLSIWEFPDCDNKARYLKGKIYFPRCTYSIQTQPHAATNNCSVQQNAVQSIRIQPSTEQRSTIRFPGHSHRVDAPAHAKTAHDGFPQKRLEEDICWIGHHVVK